MAKFSVEEIARAVKGRLICGPAHKIKGVVIDSRKVTRGCLFVAIIGERFDGHDYVRTALNNGAAAALISNPFLALSEAKRTLILVDNTVRALQDLAAYHRSRFKNLVVAGVTGSNGKTTVKNMIADVFSAKYKTLKTDGNLNNHIGVPLTLLNLKSTHRAAVIEMGMNAPGEIARLTEITRPSIGVITNVGAAHVGMLGSVAAVREAKGELLKHMPKNGVAILNAGDTHSVPLIKKSGRRTVTFGKSGEADIQLVDTWMERDKRTLVISRGAKETVVKIKLIGIKDPENAAAAFAAGLAAKIPEAKIALKLSKVEPEKMRMAPVKLSNGALIINDAYNANPQSAEAALRTVAEMKKHGRFYFVFGDMLELGEKSEEAHMEIGRLAVKLGVDGIFTIGALAEHAAREAKSHGVKTVTGKTHWEIAGKLSGLLRSGDVILIKGSRGAAMEKAAERLQEIVEG